MTRERCAECGCKLEDGYHERACSERERLPLTEGDLESYAILAMRQRLARNHYVEVDAAHLLSLIAELRLARVLPQEVQYRARKKFLGQCINCSLPASGGTRRCERHRELHNQRARDAKRAGNGGSP